MTEQIHPMFGGIPADNVLAIEKRKKEIEARKKELATPNTKVQPRFNGIPVDAEGNPQYGAPIQEQYPPGSTGVSEGITMPPPVDQGKVGEATAIKGFAGNLRSPMELWKNESLPAQFLKWLRTPTEEYDKKAIVSEKDRIRNSPLVSNIGGLLDRYEEVQQSRDLTSDEEQTFFKLQDMYGKAWDEAAKKVKDGSDWTWSDLWEGVKKDPGGIGAELVNALVADPELLVVPQTAFAKTTAAMGTAGRVVVAGLTGAAVADIDTMVRNLAEDNKIHKKDMALATGLGFISNSVLKYAGDKLVALKNIRESQGKEVDLVSVEDILKEANVDADPRPIVDLINAYTNVDKAGVRPLPEAKKDMQAAFKKEIIKETDSPGVKEYKRKQNEYIDYIQKNIDEANKEDALNFDLQARFEENFKPAKDLTPQQIIDDVVGVKDRTESVIKKDVARAKRNMNAAIKDNPEMADFYQKEADAAILERDLARREYEALKQEEIDAAYIADKAKIENKKIDDLWLEQGHRNLHRQVADILEGRKEARVVQEQDPDQLTSMEHAFDKALDRNQSYIDKLEADTNLSIYLKQGRLDAEARAATKFQDYRDMMGRLTKEEQEMSGLPKGDIRQKGEIDPKLMGFIASGTVVGGTVYAFTGDPIESGVAAVAGGVAIPYLFSKPYVMPMSIKEWARTPNAAMFSDARAIQRPLSAIQNYGEAGYALSRLMEDFNNAMDMRIASKMDHLDKAFYQVSAEDQLKVAQIMRHTLDPKDASPRVRKAAEMLQKDLDGILDEAVQYGVYTPEQVAKLRARVKAKGYFPRVYDTVYLESTVGRAHWIKTWTEHEWTEKSLTSALESIVGDNKEYVSNVIRLANKDGGKIRLTIKQARDLLHEHGRSLLSARSSHLERSRTIHPETEALLEPFLLKDTTSTLMQYYHDVYRRIEAAAVFDAKNPRTGKWEKDGKATALIKSIANDPAYGSRAASVAEETYYMMVGDSKFSKYLSLAMDSSEATKRWQRRFSDYETISKLSLAQMPNMLQAYNFGTMKLLKETNSFIDAYKIEMKALKFATTEEGKEFARLTGAANETTLLQYVSEASSRSGRLAEGTLHITGFLTAEKVQRMYAANIGKVYAEHLLGKFKKIQAGEIKGKEKDMVLAAMDELRLPTDRTVTDSDMLRAGLRFSNDVNFRNTPDQMPLARNSNFGKLFFKFKTFAFNSGRFVKENVAKPAILYGATGGKEGSIKPLLHLSTMAPITGMGVDELRRMIKGDDRDLTLTQRYIRGLFLMGGIGLTQDAIMSAVRSESGITSFVAGAAVADVSTMAHAVAKGIEDGSIYPIEDAYLNTWVLPFKEEIKKANEKRYKRKKAASKEFEQLQKEFQPESDFKKLQQEFSEGL